MPFFHKDDVNIFYTVEKCAAAHAETIVLIHTNLMDHTIFDALIPALNQEFHVVRYDLRGFGKSDLGDDELTLDLYTKDLHFLIESLQLPTVHLAGFGFGALIALQYSTLYEHVVKKLVLMTVACFPEDFYTSVKAHRNKISHDGKKIPVDTLIKKVTSLTEKDPEYNRIYQMMSRVPAQTYKKIMDLTLYTNPIPYMQKTKATTLILSAEKEIVFPQPLLAYTASYLPKFSYTVVPNASSFLMVDQPNLTAELMKAFLTKEKREIYQEDKTANVIYENVRSHIVEQFEQDMHVQQFSNQIQVDFLYHFQVVVNGEAIIHGWHKRYAKQILIYLLFHPSVSRDHLCETLWPDVPLHVSKNNFRVYLNYLKRLVNHHSVEEPILTSDRDNIYFNAHVTSDALLFMQQIKEAITEKAELNKVDIIKNTLDQLQSADYFITIYDDWFLYIRNYIEKDLIDLTVWLGHWLLDHGEISAANKYVQQALLLFDGDPLILELAKACRQQLTLFPLE